MAERRACGTCRGDELGALHTAPLGAGLEPIAFHKARLGRQSYTWLGEGRMWVWETDTWRAYVSDWKGIAFEVRADLSDEEAFAAWDDYRARLGLIGSLPDPSR